METYASALGATHARAGASDRAAAEYSAPVCPIDRAHVLPEVTPAEVIDAAASEGLTRCECGYSVDPRSMTNADAVREQLQAAGEPAPHTATATREAVQGWRPGCTCGWAHPWHFPSRAAALVAAQSVAAAHRIESGAES